jgi:signal transduction histidine kinase
MVSPARQKFGDESRFVAARIAAIYLIVGALWILFSDSIIAHLADNMAMFEKVAMFKEWFFVCVTAILLFWLIHRYTEVIRQHDRELLSARDQAETASRAKSEFLENMSHEMRTPLTGVMGIIDLLLMHEENGDKRGFLEMGKNSAESLNRLINDVLDFSICSSGNAAILMRPFNLRGCLEWATKDCAVKAAEKGVGFRLEVDGGVPEEINTDERRLGQVIENLTRNAVKFTGEGEISVSAQLSPDKRGVGRMLLFKVSDTGIGIPPEYMEHIFDSFSQADISSRKRFGGIGLGLSYCREIVVRLGGEIWVESSEGEGSTFSFTVPLQDEAGIIRYR